MIKGVLFDYDGTLSCRYKSAYCMYRWIVRENMKGRYITDYDMEAIVQKCMVWDEFGNISKDYVFRHLKTEYFPDLDIAYWKSVWTNKFAEYQVPMDGCIDLLEDLSHHYKLGVITNGEDSSQNAKIDALGIRKYFSVILTGGGYGKGKPDPAIYKEAAVRLGLSCGEIVYIGDTFATDILGAVQAGMYPLWMCYEHRGISSFPVVQVSDLKEVRSILLENYNEKENL